jgi:hypothetical protein
MWGEDAQKKMLLYCDFLSRSLKYIILQDFSPHFAEGKEGLEGFRGSLVKTNYNPIFLTPPLSLVLI